MKIPGLDLNSASRSTAAPAANGGENVGRGRRCDLWPVTGGSDARSEDKVWDIWGRWLRSRVITARFRLHQPRNAVRSALRRLWREQELPLCAVSNSANLLYFTKYVAFGGQIKRRAAKQLMCASHLLATESISHLFSVFYISRPFFPAPNCSPRYIFFFRISWKKKLEGVFNRTNPVQFSSTS